MKELEMGTFSQRKYKKEFLDLNKNRLEDKH